MHCYIGVVQVMLSLPDLKIEEVPSTALTMHFWDSFSQLLGSKLADADIFLVHIRKGQFFPAGSLQ